MGIRIVCAGLLPLLLFCGCATNRKGRPEPVSGFTYVPLDPLSVSWNATDQDRTNNVKILHLLPDNSVRMFVEEIHTTGPVSYGSAQAAVKGDQFKVTVDYINSDTVNTRLWIAKKGQNQKDGKMVDAPFILDDVYWFKPGTERYVVQHEKPTNQLELFYECNIPTYVGVGLRLTANIDVRKGKVNITGLGAITAGAETERIRGSLVVQTLGINGKSIAAALPIQSELNRTTAQNAIASVGAAKALLYEPEVRIVPRVVGLYLPFRANRTLINAIISEISRKKVQWGPDGVIREINVSANTESQIAKQ